ncbi:MAG: hypothetical protein KY462_15400 [Actinobacteria bacterium]|nr:hypothetical protein [Actinomycetota bacterium]
MSRTIGVVAERVISSTRFPLKAGKQLECSLEVVDRDLSLSTQSRDGC